VSPGKEVPQGKQVNRDFLERMAAMAMMDSEAAMVFQE